MACALWAGIVFWSGSKKTNAWLTGTGSRRLEGTNSGHKNAEGMPAVGVRVEPTVRLGRVVEGFRIKNVDIFECCTSDINLRC